MPAFWSATNVAPQTLFARSLRCTPAPLSDNAHAHERQPDHIQTHQHAPAKHQLLRLLTTALVHKIAKAQSASGTMLSSAVRLRT